MNVEKLLKLAKSGDIDAKYQLGRLAEDAGQIDEAKKWFHEAAAGGSPAAMNAIDSLLLLAGDAEKEIRAAAIKNPNATAEVKAIASLLN